LANRSTAALSRRGFLRWSAAIAGGAAAAATSWREWGSSEGPQVLVPWSGGERRVFEDVLRHYPGGPVTVLTGGDDIDSFVQSQQQTGDIPDVVILPRPGLVREYADNDWLQQLPVPVELRVRGEWRTWARAADGHRVERTYGAWVKAAHKSLLWVRESEVSKDEAESWTWSCFSAWVAERAGRGDHAPLAIGAADGWVLTDWFENVLAGLTTPAEYTALAEGRARWSENEPVELAFRKLGELWGIEGCFVAGDRALLVEFEDSVRHLVEGRADALVGSDFVAGVVAGLLDDGGGDERPTAVHFPAIDDGCASTSDDRSPQPIVVGGDLAVVRAGSTRGLELVDWLTGREALKVWVTKDGYLTPNSAVECDDDLIDAPRYLCYDRDQRLQRFVGAEIAGSADPETRPTGVEPGGNLDLRFDLSDLLSRTLTGTDGRGSWRFMARFFRDVTEGRDLDDAVADVVGRFDRAAAAADAGDVSA
jgi:hypothetical protein